MAREPIPTWFYAVIVVRREHHYLLVHERQHDETWYLPAGRVERGETFAEAALRETFEETGVPIRLTGLIRIEHSPRIAAARLRVVFLAEPAENIPPKKEPDEESLGAEWVHCDRIVDYPLRDDEVRRLVAYVETGGAIYPLDLIQWEGSE